MNLTSSSCCRGQRLMLTSGALFLGLALIFLWRWQTTAMPVTLNIDGQSVALRTHARSPQGLLQEIGYILRPQDALKLTPAWGPNAHVRVRRARPVLVQADGRTRQVWTQAQTLAGVLTDAHLSLAPEDALILQGQPASPETNLPQVQWQPPAGRRQAPVWEQRPQPVTLRIVRATPITLEADGLRQQLWTRAATVGEALAASGIVIHQGDDVRPSLDAALLPNMLVQIRRATPITLVADGRTLQIRTRQATVGDLLREQGILLLAEDQVQPPLTSLLHPHSTVRVTRIQESVEYEEELTPFETVWQPDDTLLIDTRRVGAEGRPGVLRRRYRVRYENGQEISRELEDEWLAQEPQRKVILYGRKIVPHTAMTPDGPITYWRKLRAYTTSYSPKRSGTDPSLPWYGHTRLGFTAGKGVVGVDPAVVNMSQKLYVPGYGFAIAGDTGSGLHGRHLDLGFSDDDYESWHWWSDVYLLWPPPPSYAINYVLPDWPRYKGSRNPYAGLVQENH